MSVELLSALVLVPTVGVIASLFAVMWRERRSPDDARTAIDRWRCAGGLGRRGDACSPLAADSSRRTARLCRPWARLLSLLAAAALPLWRSAPLRRLLTNQKNLIRLQVWRLEGVVFLSADVHRPAARALRAARWHRRHARRRDGVLGGAAGSIEPGGKRRTCVFNVLGLTDLIVAVTLGVTTNRGPAQLFLTAPAATLLTQFPLTLVPTFLVPLVADTARCFIAAAGRRQLGGGEGQTGV